MQQDLRPVGQGQERCSYGLMGYQFARADVMPWCRSSILPMTADGGNQTKVHLVPRRAANINFKCRSTCCSSA